MRLNPFKLYFTRQVTFYYTPRLIRVRSPVIASLSWVLFLTILFFYLRSMDMNLNKLYTSTCPVRGTVLAKVKGFTSTLDLKDSDFRNDTVGLNAYRRVWTDEDLVFPDQGGTGQTGEFAVITNLKITNQTLDTCPERLSIHDCQTDVDCIKGKWSRHGFWGSTNGVYTGKCLKGNRNVSTCEISGWCPLETSVYPRKQKPLLESVENFTVFLKNSAFFSGCGDGARFVGSNVKNDVENLENCFYDEVKDPLCPKFTFGRIANASGANFQSVAIKGAVFRITIAWNCNFLFWRSAEKCIPTYKFKLVKTVQNKNDTLSVSPFDQWSFRTIKYNSPTSRTVIKRAGFKILIELEGEGMHFNFFDLVNNLGSLLGLCCLTPLACDIVLEMFDWLAKRLRWHKKFHDSSGDEESENLEKESEETHELMKVKVFSYACVMILVIIWGISCNL